MQISTQNSIKFALAGAPWTVSVTNGSNRVISSAGADWSEINLKSYFGLDAAGVGLYDSIVDVQKPAAAPGSWANSASGKWELFLAVNYAGATDAAAAFFIQRDFLTLTISDQDYHIPIPSPGDTQTVEIWQRSTIQLIAAITALQNRPARAWDAEQGKWFPIGVFGSSGNEEIGIAGPGTTT
jgi:hypothetical protein